MIKSYIQFIKERINEDERISSFKGFKGKDMEYRNKASNKLLEKFVPIYSDFEVTNLNKFKGYKLVEKINLNYYSIVSGLFRYQTGKIDHKSYSSLYEKNPKYFNNHLLNKVAVFTNKEDAIEALGESKPIIKGWSSGSNDLALMEIVIGDNIEKAKFSNISVDDKDVFIGDSIISIKELQII